MMSQDGKERLKKHLPKIMLWRSDRSLNLDLNERQEIYDTIREVEPQYKVKWFCTHCVGEMLDKAYNYIHS